MEHKKRETVDGFHEEVIIAGFGGQGIILAGKLLAQAAMKAGKEVTYMPSYGAEVRGGTANCMVTVADSPIACPVVGSCSSLIAMNNASLDKFLSRVKQDGLIIINGSLIESEPATDDSIEILKVPVDDIAVRLGNPKAANMVALGAYLQRRRYLTADLVARALPEVLAQRYHVTLPINTEALHQGVKFAEKVARQ